MRLIRLLLSESLAVFTLAVLASVISGLATMGLLVLLFRILGAPEALQVSWWEFSTVVVVALASRGLSQLLLSYINRKSMLSARTRVARLVTDASLKDLERIGSSRLIASLTADVATIAAVLPNFVLFGANLSFVVACLGYLAWLSPERFGLIMGVIVVGIFAHQLLQREGLKHLRKSRETWDDLVQAFRTLVDGAKQLKLDVARRRQAIDQFDELAHSLRQSARNQSAFFGGAASGFQLLLFSALGVTVFGFSSSAAPQGLLISFTVSIIYMMAPLRSIAGTLRVFHEAEVALDRMAELEAGLECQNEAGSTISGVKRELDPPRDRSVRELRLEAVTHSYRTSAQIGEFTLGPVDITLLPATVVFIVGANGSGKTTLAKILTGLYMPQGGQIRLNGLPLTDASKEWYRQHFSAIFSDFYLFDHLTGPTTEVEDSNATDLLQRFRIADKVQVTGGRISNTSSLSLGERKRMALVLAYLDDRPVYLFDEWSAEQDPAFKDIFYREILRDLRRRGKLVLVISHDDRYFHLADAILRLERGRPPILLPPSSTVDAPCAEA